MTTKRSMPAAVAFEDSLQPPPTSDLTVAVDVDRNLRWQILDVNKMARAAQKSQIPICVWFTGLPSSGKTTLSNMLEQRLHAEGKHTYLLDADNVRHGLNSDLGFTQAARAENVRRIAQVAKLMVDAGLIVLVSAISPSKRERTFARALFDDYEFVEVFVDTPLEECTRRDVKGLYAKARAGLINNFTGLDSPYERPAAPDLTVETVRTAPEACVDSILAYLAGRAMKPL
jgi:bifunctional enzyme CysN/CysC